VPGVRIIAGVSLTHSEYVPTSQSRFEPQPPSLTADVSAATLRPLRDQVLVKRDPPPDQVGSIIVPDVAKRWRTTEAEVLAVGPGRKGRNGERLPMPCAVGDRVIVDKWGGDVVGVEGVAHLVLLNGEDVLAVVG